MPTSPEPVCQWERMAGSIKYLPSRQRHILFCKCSPFRQASAAHRAGEPTSLDSEVARRQEFLSSAVTE
jgi:hypothetical protein